MKDTLQKQVVNLQLSKRLKELGVPQEGLFYWVEFKTFPVKPWQILSKDELRTINFPELAISAFLVGELGELLRTELTDENESDSFTLKCGNTIDFWWATFGNDEADITPQFEDASFADCLAKMLIYLLENNLIKASDL